MSIIDAKPTSAQVIAVEPSQVLAVPNEYFWSEIAILPGVARNLMRMLVKRMRQNNELALEAHKQRLRYEYLQRDLAQARKIQQSMLPKGDLALPRHPQVDIYATVLPAKDVGGDFYDILPIDDKRFLMAVGDVSGKGMPASLLMVKALMLLRLKYNAGMDFPLLMPELNRMLCEENEACMYVTLFLALFDTASGEVWHVNAGHNPPLILSAEAECGFVDTPPATPLGLFEQSRYAVAQSCLKPGDSLILYTDGVTEAENQRGEFFSANRLRQNLQATPQQAARSLVESILAGIAQFADGAEQSDDITLLVMRYQQDRI